MILKSNSWCLSVSKYKEFRQLSQEVRCLRYEDLMADPVYAVRAIAKHFNLPEQFADATHEAMKYDSQRNSSLAASQRYKAPELTEDRERHFKTC